jgi:hypothetical protein
LGITGHDSRVWLDPCHPGWYLLYPPANQKVNPDSYPTLSEWNIDGSFSNASDCHEAHHGDLAALPGLQQNSADYLRPKPDDALRPTTPGSEGNMSRD